MIYYPDNSAIGYMGRIDDADAKSPRFFYPGSQFYFRTDASEISITVNNTNVWGELSLGVLIDGEMSKVPLDNDKNGCDTELKIAERLPAGMHEVTIYKRHAANHFFTLKSVDANGRLYSSERDYKLKMDVYGDSVCAGEVIEAVEYTGKSDPENHQNVYDNSYLSFVMQTARNLNAEINNNSQGGIALFDGSGYFHWPDYIGLETTFDKVCYFPEGGELTRWDFSRYTADIVIIAIGQNDPHNGKTDKNDLDIYDPVYRKIWKTAYKKLVRSLNDSYKGSAKFVLTTTLLCHDAEWDKAIDEIKDELCADGIFCRHNVFKRNGAATPGHPRISEHNEMTSELTAFIKENVL